MACGLWRTSFNSLAMRKSAFSKWSPFAIVFVVDCLFFINLCAWIFRCGCHSLWAGADMSCNIHMAHMKHCPFCSHGWQGQMLVMTAIWIPQAIVCLRLSWTWPARFLTALVLFPVVEGIAALIFGRFDGYWTP